MYLLLRGSCRTQTGVDDVQNRIDAPLDWRPFSPTCKHALNVRLHFMLFCRSDLFVPVPDETAHCHFRNTRVKGGVHDDLLGSSGRGLP
ncbi:MAG: transposase, partial [Rhodobacteraceae bacterium]|nr:transposase [Paracoccaceae bacterium]